jgi:hypothetical protein
MTALSSRLERLPRDRIYNISRGEVVRGFFFYWRHFLVVKLNLVPVVFVCVFVSAPSTAIASRQLILQLWLMHCYGSTVCTILCGNG